MSDITQEIVELAKQLWPEAYIIDVEPGGISWCSVWPNDPTVYNCNVCVSLPANGGMKDLPPVTAPTLPALRDKLLVMLEDKRQDGR